MRAARRAAAGRWSERQIRSRRELQIEPQLGPDVSTLLAEELALGGEPVMRDESDPKLPATRSRGQRHTELGRGADSPVGGRRGFKKHAGDGPKHAAEWGADRAAPEIGRERSARPGEV